MYKRQPMDNSDTVDPHLFALLPTNEVNTLDSMEACRRLSDREIEHLIELRRQEECLRKVTSVVDVCALTHM